VNAVINTAIPQGGNAMKHSISTLAIATLVAIASLTQAHAQTNASKVNVPFAFDFGSQHYAAGTYTIDLQGADNLVLVNDAKRSTRLALIESRTDSGSSIASASLTFRKYVNTYFLAKYSTSGATFTLMESSKERSLAREQAMNQTEPSLVQLAALGHGK
jgi:hypothetical protein